MIKLEFTYGEANLLHRILHDHLSELDHEMTVNQLEGFIEILRAEQTLIQRILDELEARGVGISAEMFGGYPE